MSLVDLIRAAGASVGSSASWRRQHPTHDTVAERSQEWNAWRDRQALHPSEQPGPARKPAPPRTLTDAQRRARRLSTRASRRRAGRKSATR
jgi:hypothetical protein